MRRLFRLKCRFNFLKKGKLKLLSMVVSLVLPLMHSQMALAAVDNHNNSKVSAKCHVLLVGGNEIISLWYIQQKQLKKLKDNIVGKKVLPQQSIQRIKIYQAFECVLEDDTFQSGKARLLDSQTPR